MPLIGDVACALVLYTHPWSRGGDAPAHVAAKAIDTALGEPLTLSSATA
jgi:hypothetical protein